MIPFFHLKPSAFLLKILLKHPHIKKFERWHLEELLCAYFSQQKNKIKQLQNIKSFFFNLNRTIDSSAQQINQRMEKIGIIGAGPVGSLLGVALAQRGYNVHIYEKRSDIRNENIDFGRSINLGLSLRGWNALKKFNIMNKYLSLVIPLRTRAVHDENGNVRFQKYGIENNHCISSIMRKDITGALINDAEKSGASYYFSSHVCGVDLENAILYINSISNPKKYDVIICADGAHKSIGRKELEEKAQMKCEISNLIGYREIDILSDKVNDWWPLDRLSLHVWPRGSNMTITGLPNLDKTFTCDLFLPLTGPGITFENMTTIDDWNNLFKTKFYDIYSLTINSLSKSIKDYPLGYINTITCDKYTYKNKFALIGDSAHAMSPFYGQGMNCGFEDVVVIDELLEKYNGNWGKVFEIYEKLRVPDGSAMARMANANFNVLSKTASEEKYQAIKNLEIKLTLKYQNEFYFPYQCVVFQTNLRYSVAEKVVALLHSIYEEIDTKYDIVKNWDSKEVEEEVMYCVRKFFPNISKQNLLSV